MPYILPPDRPDLDKLIDELVDYLRNIVIENELDIRDLDGRLNYIIIRLLADVFSLREYPKYTNFNTVTGILEQVKMEIQRRLVSPYEDIKLKKNGDF